MRVHALFQDPLRSASRVRVYEKTLCPFRRFVPLALAPVLSEPMNGCEKGARRYLKGRLHKLRAALGNGRTVHRGSVLAGGG
jgi:hypothetical protein